MKKTGFLSISAGISVLFFLAGCALLPAKGNISKTETQEGMTAAASAVTTTKITDKTLITETAVQSEPPQVFTYYTLKKAYPVNNGFTPGFDIKLPRIESENLGALEINLEIDKLKANIEKAYFDAGNANDYREQYIYSYETNIRDSIIFISITTSYGLMESEYITANFHYAYNYITDKAVTDYDIASIFNLNDTQIIKTVNSELAVRGVPAIESFDKIDLYVNASGKLIADVKVESEIGGEYSELVELA